MNGVYTDEAFELRVAVEALTEPTFTKISQYVDGEERVTRIKHDPLLTQLDDAIRGAMSATMGGAASTPSTRSLVNSDALYQLTLIASILGEWCRLAGAPIRRDPVTALQGWHASVLAQDIPRAFYTQMLRRWAGTIRAVVNPPRELTVTRPCPECTATHWENTDGEKAAHPVVIAYRPDDTDVLTTATARCRACLAEWRGVTALRSLAFDLENLEPTHEPNEQEQSHA